MDVDGQPCRTIRLADDGWSVEIIDQTLLPHEFARRTLHSVGDAAEAIAAMRVRGAPLIGATAAYGLALQARVTADDVALRRAAAALLATRPTAVNLRWAVEDMLAHLGQVPEGERCAHAYRRAAELCDADVAACESIGEHGLGILTRLFEAKGATGRIDILTHCNAGWLATVDWGTALAPIYKAQRSGLPVHVWVDETRPRNQGAGLTAWELAREGVPHTVVVDNAGGHLMQHGLVDVCITGTDRTTATGDVANKVGTYLKALAAHDNDVPFYVALPGSTIDWRAADGLRDIPIEERSPDEVTTVTGRGPDGRITTIAITPEGTEAANYSFDVTPARLITGLITERGVAEASRAGLRALFPEAPR